MSRGQWLVLAVTLWVMGAASLYWVAWGFRAGAIDVVLIFSFVTIALIGGGAFAFVSSRKAKNK